LHRRSSIAYVEIRAFAHATEDIDRVLSALRNMIPDELAEAVAFRRVNTTGHHGNPIVLLETKIREKKTAGAVFERISSKLGIMDKEILRGEIHTHLEKGNLYVRLDKQAAYLNEMRLGREDPIRVRVHFKEHNPEEVIEICRELGLLP
jgi:RNA binding exosome subunit